MFLLSSLQAEPQQTTGHGCAQVNDGTTLAGLQVVVQPEVPGYDLLESGTINTGAAVRVQGDLVESPGKGQKVSCLLSVQCMSVVPATALVISEIAASDA